MKKEIGQLDKETGLLKRAYIKEESEFKAYQEQTDGLTHKIEELNIYKRQMRTNTVVMKKIIDKLRFNVTRQDVKSKDFVEQINKLTEYLRKNFN
jgi:hypothetical protein